MRVLPKIQITSFDFPSNCVFPGSTGSKEPNKEPKTEKKKLFSIPSFYIVFRCIIIENNHPEKKQQQFKLSDCV